MTKSEQVLAAMRVLADVVLGDAELERITVHWDGPRPVHVLEIRSQTGAAGRAPKHERLELAALELLKRAGELERGADAKEGITPE